jgi:hypothetical protein
MKDGQIDCPVIKRHNLLTGSNLPTVHEPTYGCRAWEKRAHKIRVYGTKPNLIVVDEMKGIQNEPNTSKDVL